MYLIIFGASGDLAKRKLFPALAKCDLKNVQLIAFARTLYDKPFSEILKDFYSYEDESFCDTIKYIQGRCYTDLEILNPYLNEHTIIYLSLPPEIYLDTLKVLNTYQYKSIAVEKPFGADYKDFVNFKEYPTEKLYFIDHFLLKPLIVSWPILINSNHKLKNILNNEHIKSIKVIFKEEIGGEGRRYFDTHGFLKDVVQNHLSEILAVIATEQKTNSCNKHAENRVEFFKNMKIIEELSLFGQYNEYCHEMSLDSTTETFSLVTLEVNLDKWKYIPLIMIAGKGLNEKKTEVILEFKRNSFKDALDFINEYIKNKEVVYQDKEDVCQDNGDICHIDEIKNIRLVCNLTPKSEVYLEIEMENKLLKYKIFTNSEIQKHMVEKYGNYENHEIVFNSFINDNDFDVVRFHEADLLWKIYGCILKKDKPLFYYSKGSDIPNEVEQMLEKIENKYN
ncbi:glucose-6-phosphate 1-dehydrogenase (G6PD) [Vairimorpha necatrix]|uniref:Glucose-6-phosphate 1-dehydrogenase n=1 Tax=Vairimorpha necatrix TaxID=6039 RepID=A0AAX4JDZ5_9MICR